jgi:hypothetical protein
MISDAMIAQNDRLGWHTEALGRLDEKGVRFLRQPTAVRATVAAAQFGGMWTAADVDGGDVASATARA